MLARFIFFGLLHGWVAIMGPYSASVAGDKRQTEVIGMVIAAGTGMQLVGPAIAGWTYALVPNFPALVPSLLGSCLGCMAICLFGLLRFRDKKSAKSEENLPEGPTTTTKQSITQL